MQEQLIINGGSRLEGEIKISTAKNAILPILAASLLCSGQCIFHETPMLEDVLVMCQVLRDYGSRITWEGHTLMVDNSNLTFAAPTEDLMKKMRASNLVLGPLLSRFGKIKISYPGGCAIGSRPMNYHLFSLSQLGAEIKDEGAYIEASAIALKGADIYLDFPSVGATENILMAATMAEGTTYIRNAAREPEIIDLAAFLNLMGAEIVGAGSDVIQINGVQALHGVEYTPIKDRIELGTMMLAAAITRGDVFFPHENGKCISALIAKMKETGSVIEVYDNGLRVKNKNRPKAIDVRTMPYPGFPTDLQPQFMSLMAGAMGTAIISENIFENRFRHSTELTRMGAHIKIIGKAAVINGCSKLCGANVEATDLRAGAALVLAALGADGQTSISNIEHIDRGYEHLEEKLALLGGKIKRIELVANTIYQKNCCFY